MKQKTSVMKSHTESEHFLQKQLLSQLTRRPTEISAGEKVKMQMSHCLSAILAAVVNYSPTVFGKALFLGKLRCNSKYMTDNCRILIRQVIARGNVQLGNNYYVRRGLRL